MTNRNSPFQQASKSCISVILVGPVIPVDPERLEHLWFDSWVIGNIITEKFHLLWRALFICDHKGFTFHPSSNHHHHHHYHHVITIIIKSTSPYHHVITIIITSSPPVSKDHIYHRISRKRLHQLKRFSNHGEKRRKRWLTFSQSQSAICTTLT